jgi:hypothetical protein
MDFISIDVEGAELAVLEGLNLSKWKFGVVCIETMNVEVVQRMFESHNYEKIGYVNGNLLLKSLSEPK